MFSRHVETLLPSPRQILMIFRNVLISLDEILRFVLILETFTADLQQRHTKRNILMKVTQPFTDCRLMLFS